MKLLVKREYWMEMREAGRQFVEQERTWATSVANYQQVYERLSSSEMAKKQGAFADIGESWI